MTRQMSAANSDSQIERRKIDRYAPMPVMFASVNCPVIESVTA